MEQDNEYPIERPQEEDGFDLTVKEDKDRYLTARDGDHLMVPFQCDTCNFCNLQHRDPGTDSKDVTLMRAIRRASLDAFWGREPSTVAANKNGAIKVLKISGDLGLENIFPEMRPFGLKDNLGMGIATCLLRRSLDRGKYRETLQFETVRKLHSAYSNI